MTRRILMAVLFLCAVRLSAVTFEIAYEDKQIYVPGSDVHIKLTITNDTPDTFRFKLAENRLFSIDLNVRSLSNQALPPAPQFTTERTSHQQLFYRDVALEPGEEFSFIENLGDFVLLDQSGVFIVQGRFYPELVGDAGMLLSSNTLSLTIQPDLRENELVAARINEATGEILATAALPPDEVVAYALGGLQSGSFNRFLLYMDLEGLLLSNPQRERSYRRLNELGQRERLERFALELQDQLEDPDLSARPTNFEMIRTSYDQDEATVVMDLEFEFTAFTELKRYTYFLRRRDAVWYIYDYAVTNIGTE